MASLFDRLRAKSPSLRSSTGEDAGWVSPGNYITRAILAAGQPVPEYAEAAPVAPTVHVPAQTLAEIEAATAEDEAAADAFEAARQAALGIKPGDTAAAASAEAPAGDGTEGKPASGGSAEAA